ncbi:MAG: DNA primase [Chitinophagales bacterium]|nr:DNA primase [Chitinophagales bacterium]MDW8393327.1 DNA primase [Chitinophagales bacterium]
MISSRTKEQVLALARIEEVIGQFVALKKRGSSYIGLCPFHSEKTPSFHVSPQRGIFKCFGCGKGGDVITFLMEHERMAYPDALRHLAAQYHVELDFTPADQDKKNEKESLLIVLQFAQQHFHHNLLHTTEGMDLGLEYFRERGISDEIIRRFQLGYACGGGHDLVDAARKAHHSVERLQQLGLISEKSGNDFFQERIIFPIQNLTGKPVGFAGRVMRNSQQAAKYINSPESELFRKGQMLYGLSQARDAIRKTNECFLVEGYMDVLALHLAGLENVVASCGTALTEEQVKLMGRFTENVTLIFDGDAAGLKAALRGTEVLLSGGLQVRMVALPGQHDPHSYYMQFGADALREFVTRRKTDLISFQAELLLSEAGTDPLKKAEAIKQIVLSLAAIPDAIKRQVLVKHCSERFGISESVLNQEINAVLHRRLARKAGYTLPQVSTNVAPRQAPLNDEQKLFELEKALLRLLLLYGDKPTAEGLTVAELIDEALREVDFRHPQYRQMLKAVRKLRKGGILPAWSDLYQQLEPDFQQQALDIIASPYSLSENWEGRHNISVLLPENNFEEELCSLLCHYELAFLRHWEQENNKELKQADTVEKQVQCQRVQLQIAERKKALARRRGIVVL